jgi:hypothetical protein
LTDVRRTVLLVGDRQEPEVAGRAEAAAGQVGQGDRAGGHLVLHVDRAAAVEVPVVVDDALERRVRPVPGIGRYDVRVADEGQRGGAVGSGDPGDQVRAVGLAGDQLARHPGVLEVAAQVLGGPGLVAGRVGGVETDQVAGERDDLVLQVLGKGVVRHEPDHTRPTGRTG